MENWGKRLKEIREKHELSQSKIGMALGKDVTQISRYERGGVKKMPKEFRHELKEFFTDEEIKYIESGGSAEKIKESSIQHKTSCPPTTISVPVLSATASAGGGSNVESIDVYESGENLAIDREFFGGVPVEKIRGIKVDGYSMVPVLLPGNWVFFEEGDRWEGDGLYVLVFRNVLMVKIVEANPENGNLRIRSANPDYETWEYDPTEDQSTFRIVGRVRRVMM